MSKRRKGSPIAIKQFNLQKSSCNVIKVMMMMMTMMTMMMMEH